MNDTRLAELKEMYKSRNLMEELAWGTYANHSGYTSKQNGEFLNWLCLMAYKALKEMDKREFDNAINESHDDGFKHGYLQAELDYKVVLEQIKAEIEDAKLSQTRIALGCNDRHERIEHLKMESAYSLALEIIDKHINKEGK